MDLSFSRNNLARCFVPKDFYIYSDLDNDDLRDKIINDAYLCAQKCFGQGIVVQTDTSSGKPTYSVQDLPSKLVLRLCSKQIKFIGKVHSKTRKKIIKELITYLSEGSEYRIYRLDIASFFEHCSVPGIVSSLEMDGASTHLLKVVQGFFSEFQKAHPQGIPRGIEIGPVLANYSMKAFDAKVSNGDEILYYARFVDDIIAITTGSEDPKKYFKSLQAALPDNLHYNHNKKTITKIENRSNGSNIPVASFEFLGYRLSVFDDHVSRKLRNLSFRRVNISLSERKIKKLLTKIHKTFIAFSKNGDFNLLKERMVFLTTNRDMINKQKDRRIPTGIYYNYTELNFPSDSLQRLDKEYRNIVLHYKGRLGKAGARTLSTNEKRALLKISFVDGYKNRTFKRYSPNMLQKIARIW